MGGFGKAITGFFGDIFGGGSNDAPAAVAPPTPAAPSVMPTPDDKAVKLANQRKLALQNQKRATRDSTILTDNATDELGA